MANRQPLRRLLDPRRPLTYGIVQAGENVPGGVPYIRPVDMTSSAGVADPDALLRTSPEIAAQYRRSEVRQGDLVLSIGPSYGKVMIVPQELSGSNLTQGTARLALGERLDRRWAYWFLQSQIARDHWNLSVAGGTFAALNLGPLGDTPVPVWPVDHQRRIANFLDDKVARIDNIIASRRSQIELIDSQRVCELDSVINDDERPAARLALFAQIQSGITVDAGRETVDGIDVPYLRVANVQAGALNLDEVKSIRVARSQVSRYLLRDGDVLMTEGGDIDKLGRGTVWRSQVPYAIHQNHVFAVRVDRSRLIPEYLAYVTASSPARDYFELTGIRTTNLASTSATKVLDLRIPVRGVGEQARVVSAAQEADSHARAGTGLLLDSIARVEELKRSLITAAVTGEFEVSSADGSRVRV